MSVLSNWQRRYNVVALSFLAVTICYIDRVNISVAIIPMSEELGWDLETRGLVLASFAAGYITLQIVGGRLADRFGGKVVLGAVVSHAAIRLAWFRASAIWWVHYPLFATAASSAWFCYASLAHIGAPTYDASGALVDGGADLSLGGMSSYYHDVVYVSSFALFATAFVSDWFWLVGLVIPGFATYKLWADIILPWIFTPTAEEEEANARMHETKEQRKKREKQEKRAERRGRGRV